MTTTRDRDAAAAAAVVAAERAAESEEGDFLGKVTADELWRIARLKVDHANGPGTWDALDDSERGRLVNQANSWCKCIDAILAQTRRLA